MIAFDLQAVQSIGNSERGIARFVTEVVRHLIAGPHGDRVDLFLWNDRLPRTERLDELGLGDRLRSFSSVAGQSVDVLHVNSPFELPRLVDQLPPVRARRLVTTCYDLIPYLFPERYIADRFASAAYRRRLGMIATSDAVVTDSQSAADDVIEYLGLDARRVTVLGAGVSAEFGPPDEPLADRIASLRSEWPDLSARYVLVPTAADWRKNSIGAIDAFARLPRHVRDRHQLVLFCRLTDDQRAKLELAAEEAGVGDRVVFTGFVPDDLLVALYQSAELVMFPTYYEGFGLPVLEARRCGARVICSNNSSLPEVLVDVRARFNAFDPSDVAATLERALTDDDTIALLERVPDPEFSWDLAVDRLVEVYDGLLARIDALPPRVPPGDDRVRVAVVGSLVHDRRGEVQRLRELVLHPLVADDRFHVTAYSIAHQPALLGDDRCPVRPFAGLGLAWESGEVDVVVYAVDQEVSRAQLGLMNLVPGHVVLTSERHPDVPEDRVLSMHSGGDDDLVGVLTAAINAASRGAPAAST
ncbi:glycosyltransferase family 4 protein [Ilumatobacter sp.]|uniref:glycosyltransferase family 4 protein n=1 Tax=Ilumatobacter sp. TaxID=1967498 RepID=UPI003AF73C93